MDRNEISGFTLTLGRYSLEVVTLNHWPVVLAYYHGASLIFRIGN